ncbi:MAG: ROK family protein, partial [Tenericutes bacterium]|nr:ROK family protein [Mycoplasmatota bacterium]
GSDLLGKQIIEAYSKNGIRSFDQKFMSNIYEQQFEVLNVTLENVPSSNEVSKSIGRHLNGCRIGFDAGGSDRKVSALIDGVAIFSEEVIWHPKIMSDPNYHYKGIMDSLKKAASKLPRVDAIGVSSAGIFINNRVSVASLFIEVPQNLFNTHIRDMYLKIQNEFGNVPLEVINDGDVTALAGAMSLDSNNVLGIAMGTSEAAGYVDKFGNITGWLNELAFVPVDYNQNSLIDDWSEDYGVGVTYFSQDAVIKLAKAANIVLETNISPAEKLKVIQNLSNENDAKAIEIFKTIGVSLGYSLAYYSRFYEIKNVLILGRVTSGIGGQIILEEAKNILKKEFNNLYKKLTINLPDENNRRVGQSIAAASLPKITK